MYSGFLLHLPVQAPDDQQHTYYLVDAPSHRSISAQLGAAFDFHHPKYYPLLSAIWQATF
jgi:hypothetical protein